MQVKIVISIINYNNTPDTISCLKSLDDLVIKDMSVSVVVIDNASREAFPVDISLKNLPVTVLRSEVNTGFSGGHNIGIRHALQEGADYILILNNDTEVNKHLVEELLQAIKQEEMIGVAVPKIYFAKGQEFHKDRYKVEEQGRVIWYAGGKMDWRNIIGHHRGVDEVDNGQYERVEETAFATGCCMLVKRDVFEKVGFFDEKYFLYYEDSDLSMRVRKKGWKIIYTPRAMLWHSNAGSTGGSGSRLQDYFISRNRLLFGFRYASLRTRISLLRESIRLLFNGRQWQKHGIIDFYLRKFGKGSYHV